MTGIARGVALAVALLHLGCGQEPAGERSGAPAPPRTNLVLVTIDTLRADALGAYDPSRATSPRIDALAAGGVLFEQVVASAPSTLPSHASILTGKQPYVHGVRANQGYVLPPANRTLAEVLRDAGYVTAAEVAAPVIARRTGLDQGFAHYRDPYSYEAQLMKVRKSAPEGGEVFELKERSASDITRRGIEFLRSHRASPFFLWLHYFDPHHVWVAPPEFRARFPDSGYHAEVAFVDAEIGRLVDELDRLGIAGRTLLVVTSDHGEGLGEHDEQTHSFFVYDSTIRVPLVFWGPDDLPRGARIRELVRSVDIAPTVLDWLGLPPLEGVQGVSLRPLMLGAPWHRELVGYGESIESYATFGTSILRFVRKGPWKYIHKVNPELYDVETSPAELDNRAAQEPAVVAGLRAQLEALVREAPASASGSEVELDADALAELEALGYVVSAHRPGVRDELESLEVAGVDPKETLPDQDRFGEALGLKRVGDHAGAAAILEELLGRYPSSLPVLRLTIETLHTLGRNDEAMPLLRRALELQPTDIDLRLELVDQLQRSGDLEEAEVEARRAIEQDRCQPYAVSFLSNVLRDQGRFAEQRSLLEQAVERCQKPELRNDLAYLLATCPDANYRDGAEAVRLARSITSGIGASDPIYLDTLAAAQAEAGDLASAVEISRRALALVESRESSEEMRTVFREHLETLEAGDAIREN